MVHTPHSPLRCADTGESVKARAQAWTAAGQEDKAREIIKRRSTLLARLSELDTALYGAQTNNKKLRLNDDALQEALRAAIVALDAVIEKMDCDRRWSSGKCEILPLPENSNLRDLIY